MNTKLKDPSNPVCAFRKVEVSLSAFPSVQRWQKLKGMETEVSVRLSLA